MSKIKITLNGEDYFLRKNCLISELIDELNLDIDKVAIEKNLEIILNANFSQESINENDKIEIVAFIGGG